MSTHQPGILADVPKHARYLTYRLRPGCDPRPALGAISARPADGSAVVGLGLPLVRALGASIEGLRAMPPLVGPGAAVPSTPAALWCWLRGDERGALLHAGRTVTAAIASGFALESVTDGFFFDTGRDLTGFEDGTENPKDAAAIEAAVVSGRGVGLDGGSFVAVQRWVHDLTAFDAMGAHDQNHVIGRDRVSNVELADAPASAHVKRTAQESFDPPGFILRRSMPWADGREEGLVFVAFGRTLDAFEAELRRMVGAEDGITDALFRFTRPVTGAYFWCPPLSAGRLDLRSLSA